MAVVPVVNLPEAGEALARPDQDDLSAAARAFVEGVARPGAKPEQS